MGLDSPGWMTMNHVIVTNWSPTGSAEATPGLSRPISRSYFKNEYLALGNLGDFQETSTQGFR